MEEIDFRSLQYANVAAVVIMIVWNALVNILPLNNVNTGVVSDSYPNLFTPPGYIFAIWGIIYTLAIIFMLYQVRSSQRSADYLWKIGRFYLVSSLINVVWLVFFHYSYGVKFLYIISTGILLVLLLDLLLIYVRLGVGGEAVPRGIKLAVHFPMSIYLGWISVASIAALASAINVMVPGIPLETQAIATAAMLVVAFVLTGFMLWMKRDIVFALVVIWAVMGISTKQAGIPIIYITALTVAALAAAAILLTPVIRKMNWVQYYLS
jgi:benzodiazapine receptor